MLFSCHLSPPSSRPGGVGAPPAAPGAASVGVWDKDFPVGHGMLKSGEFLLRRKYNIPVKGLREFSSPLHALHASETFANQFLLWLVAVSESPERKGPHKPKPEPRPQSNPAPQSVLGWPNSRQVEGDGEAVAFPKGTKISLGPSKQNPERDQAAGSQGKSDLSLPLPVPVLLVLKM